MDDEEAREVTVGGRRGARWRSLAAVALLGLGAGGGGVVGLALGLAWVLPGRLSGSGPTTSVGGVLLAGGLGALLGALLGTALAAGAVAVLGAVLRQRSGGASRSS